MPDKSNVLSMLKSIEQLFSLCQDDLNTCSQTSLMLSLTIESQMLLMKLRVMRERWKYHLPFKEACKVRFDKWSRRTARMASYFADKPEGSEEPISEDCPSKHFLLDFYSLLPENTESQDYVPYYKETAMNRFVVNQERIRKQITERWKSHYKQRFSDLVAQELVQSRGIDLQPLQENGKAIRTACYDILTELSEELSLLNEMQEPDILPEQFARLADRVFSESDYEGRQSRDSARWDVKTWRNKTPKRRLEQSRKEEIDASIKSIEELRFGRLLAEYIGDDFEIKGHSEGVGQFLHHVRDDITPSELADLMKQLYRIRLFREHKEQQERTDASLVLAASPYAGVAESRRSVEGEGGKEAVAMLPQRPKLPYFFREALSEDKEATSLFYDLLHRTERYMTGKLTEEEKRDSGLKPYKKWKWNHLRVAFVQSGFIEKDTPKQHFANFVNSVFPYQKEASVIRSIQRYNENAIGFDRIVREISKEFEDVKKMAKI